MANKLTDMEFSSVDLCKRGANQKAKIRLFKSDDPERGGETETKEKNILVKMMELLQGVLDESEPKTITKAAGAAQVRETTEALRKSLESIIDDDSLTAVEKHDMMAESLQQFTLEATDLMDGWADAIGKAEDPIDDDPDDPEYFEDPDDPEMDDEDPDDMNPGMEPGAEPENKKTVEKGVFDMATIDITKMSPEDKEILDQLAKKYGEVEEAPAAQEVHPDVKKAIDEVAELRKSLEIKELEGVAKKYEVIGKKAEELAPKLYELKKAGEQHYNDYVALLDEQVQMADSGIFKEIGSSRSGASDLEATVAELMKADCKLTRAQAVVKAFEMNPNLDPFSGKNK